MKYITQLLCSVLLGIGFLANANATSVSLPTDNHANYQTEDGTTDETKKKEDEEEPDC